MRREFLGLLILSAMAFAAIDQEYIQVVARNGSSAIEKTTEVAIFSDQLAADALLRMEQVCKTSSVVDCSVDVDAKKVTMREDYLPGTYYSYSTEYGLPFVTHTISISKVPTDRFSRALGRLLVLANATAPAAGGGSVNPIDLLDAEENGPNVEILRRLDANLTYAVVMPLPVAEASAGEAPVRVDGDRAEFDLIGVMEAGKPMVVRSRELNLGYMVAIAGIVVVAALALAFFRSKPARKGRLKKTG
ncbi:MAG: hypothetical protein AB1529_01330 [Candidatus Micrarchaeota archaeon]